LLSEMRCSSRPAPKSVARAEDHDGRLTHLREHSQLKMLSEMREGEQS
jgi:hypothetical protein